MLKVYVHSWLLWFPAVYRMLHSNRVYICGLLNFSSTYQHATHWFDGISGEKKISGLDNPWLISRLSHCHTLVHAGITAHIGVLVTPASNGRIIWPRQTLEGWGWMKSSSPSMKTCPLVAYNYCKFAGCTSHMPYMESRPLVEQDHDCQHWLAVSFQSLGQDFFSFLPWHAKDWPRDLLHSKRVLYHWAMAFSLLLLNT